MKALANYLLSLIQKAALEHTAKTIDDIQLAYMLEEIKQFFHHRSRLQQVKPSFANVLFHH